MSKTKQIPQLVGTIFVSRKGMGDDTNTDRRRNNRNGHRMLVRFWDPHSSRCHDGILTNDSDGGAFIETQATMPLLTEIRIEGPGIICDAVVCRVHWLRPDEQAMGYRGGIAVRLMSTSNIEDADFESDDGIVLSYTAAVSRAR